MQLEAIWDYALQYCINKGLAKEEMDFYRIVPNLQDITNDIFLSELAWCVYNAGMKEEVIRKKWPALRKAFMEFDPQGIIYNSAECLKAALDIFNHPGKAGAVMLLHLKS
jgi:3-methyladenine DNA glycosylase Tag